MRTLPHLTIPQHHWEQSSRILCPSESPLLLLSASGTLLPVDLQYANAPIDSMPAAYEIRAGGDVKNKKQSMADLKLRRLNELNSRLREDLERPRIKVSEASMS